MGEATRISKRVFTSPKSKIINIERRQRRELLQAMKDYRTM